MLIVNLLFYLLSGILVYSSIWVVVASHSVFSLLFLILSFVSLAFILFILECDFLALIFIVVYVGAVAVLFLFSVMMLDAKLQKLTKNLLKYIPIGFFFVLCFFIVLGRPIFLEISKIKIFFTQSFYLNWYFLTDSTAHIYIYGQILYNYFVFHFLIVGLILLVVLIGVVYLTNNYKSNTILNQSVYKQLAVRSNFLY